MQKTTYPFIITFRHWAVKYLGNTHILLRRVVKNAFYAFRGMFREKPFAEKKYPFFIFIKSFAAVFSELHSNCPEEHFEVYFWKFHFVLSFSDNEKKTVGRLSKTTQQCFKKWFLLVQGKNLRRKFFYFEVCFKFFPFSAEIFERFGEKNGGCVVKTMF